MILSTKVDINCIVTTIQMIEKEMWINVCSKVAFDVATK